MAKRKYGSISRHSKAGKVYKRKEHRKKVVDTATELVLGKKAYKHSKERKETMSATTKSRRELNKIIADSKRKLNKIKKASGE